MKRQAITKDILIVIMPLLVAGLTVFFSTKSKQQALQQSGQIETAKIIISLMEDILKGGENAHLAKIAFENVPMTESQQQQLATFLEEKVGGSDRISQPTHLVDLDTTFPILLDKLFDDRPEVRRQAYTDTRDYLKANPDTSIIAQMFDKVRSNPFNIKGRSNVLSIVSSADSHLLLSSQNRLQEELRWIADLEKKSPSYAIGPQTKGWMNDLENRLHTQN